MLKIDNIKIYEDLTEDKLQTKILQKYKINPQDILSFTIIKKSIDARDKNNVHYNYTIHLEVSNETKYPHLKRVENIFLPPINKRRNSSYKPIIIGSGPAGLFCALTLINNGYEPIIIEQGSSVDERISIVNEYRYKAKINTTCNVQFGEGGAGTFSDGKLTTGISSPYIKEVLNYFYQFGAPKEITYLSHPHIGTDNLIVILKNIRSYIESKGGKYYFNTKFIDFKQEDNYLKVICENQEFTTDALVLAIGHSSRDTIRMLYNKNINITRKNFSVGVRIEHHQDMINKAQYGTKTKINLPPAEYKLVYHGPNRSCYTFCMCPGGEVIASSSEPESIVTNGMSLFNRAQENANSALLVNIQTTDFSGIDPLAGLKFQEQLEHQAYLLAGSNYNAPVQRVEDFLNNQKSTHIGKIIPSYKPGYTLCNLNDLFPKFISDTLKEGIQYFDHKIKGFANPDAILTGVETRSSSPVTITRNENYMSNIKGIYPCGEGAGYAGGITSAAIDGIKVATKIIENNQN